MEGHSLHSDMVINTKDRLLILVRSSVVLALVLVLALPLPGQAKLFGEFGLQEEMKMGREFEVMVKSIMPLVEDPEVKFYVQDIVDRIVKTLPPQPYKFNTSVLLQHNMNAFATPGGFVFVHTGLIQHLEHESELAGVLAHEIAHVTQRHIARRVERGQIITIASMAAAILGGIAGGGGEVTEAAMIGSQAAAASAMLSYSRADETDADQFGLQYLVAAGYSPNGLGGAFSKIQSQNWGRGSNFPDYLSTHPGTTTRLTTLNSRIQSLPADVQARKDDDARFRRIQTLIWSRYGDTQHALQVFESRDPKDPMTHMGKGILAARLNRVKDAEDAFTEALRLAPNDSVVQREAGTFHYNKGDIALARQQLERALQLNRDDYLARFFYARLLDDQGNSGEAQKNYQEVLRFVPEDSEVHYFYGLSLGKSHDTFKGYLHLAYASLYANDEKRAQNWEARAKSAASGPDNQEDLKRYETTYAERKRVWQGKS